MIPQLSGRMLCSSTLRRLRSLSFWMRWLMLILFEKRDQHEVSACQGDFGGKPRTLGGDGLFRDLHKHILACGDHVFHIALFVDVLLQFEIGEVTRTLRSLDGPLGIFLETTVLRAQIQVVEEGILRMSYVHESRVQTGQHLFDPAEVNVPDRIFLVAFVLVELDQMAVLQHGNTQPGLGLVDDQFDVHASLHVSGVGRHTLWLPAYRQ